MSLIIGVILILVVIGIIGMSSSAHTEIPAGDNMVLKLIYTLLIAIFVAVFVGVGIAAFYPGPKYPEPPTYIKYGGPEIVKGTEMDEQTKAELEKFEKEEKAFRDNNQTYSRNVSIISLIASILIVVASLTLFKKILIIADGLLLGGVLTLLYSVIRGFEAEDNMFRFLVVSVGLAVSLGLGYIKFIKPAENQIS